MSFPFVKKVSIHFIFFEDENFDYPLDVARSHWLKFNYSPNLFDFSLKMSLKSGFYSYLHCHGLISSLSSSFSQIITAVSCHSLSLILSAGWSPLNKWFCFFSNSSHPWLSRGYRIKSTFRLLAYEVTHSVRSLSIRNNTTSLSTRCTLCPGSFRVLSSQVPALLYVSL